MNTPRYSIEPTHVRKPVKGRRGTKVRAQLLSVHEGQALYRVAYKAGREEVVRHTASTFARFERDFREVA